MNINSKLLLLGVATFASLQVSAQHDSPGAAKTPFINKADMDVSVKPGNDFYQYASGTWIKNNPVPAKETRWGSFNKLRDFNINAVKTLVTTAAANKKAAPGSVEKRVGDFYAAGMDSIAIEKAGATPIKADLEKINAVKTSTDVLSQAAYMRTAGIGSPMFGFFVGQDRKNVEVMIPQLSQGGTTLPDRDYYLKDDSRSQKIREAYKNYMVKLFTLSGVPAETAEKNAETVFNIEKAMAEAQMSRVEMRDPQKTYNKFAVADLTKTTPAIDWKTLMTQMKVTGQDTVLVNSPAFFAKLNSLLTTTPVND